MIEEKQKFLRENILDEGYDANEFLEFISNKRGEDEVDLDNWTMEELNSVVNEFITIKSERVPENVSKNKYSQPKPQSKTVYTNNISQSMPILKIIPKKSTFFVDDFIEGQVELSNSTQIIIKDINLTLNSDQNWILNSNDSKSSITENKKELIYSQNFDIKNKLNTKTDLVPIKPGKILLNFKFKIPKVIEPSFEYPGKNNKAYVRYFLMSNIISSYTKGSATSYIILKKRQAIEMNKQIILNSVNNIHKWGLFNAGITKLKITSINGTDNFRFGEDIKFDIDIDNTNGQLNSSECKIVLKRNILFKNNNSKKKLDILEEVISQKIKTETNPGEHKNFPSTLSLRNINNKQFNIEGSKIPYTNFSDINYFMPSIKTALIECSYTIKFTLYFDTFVNNKDRPRIIMNVIICHQSIDEYKAEMNQKISANKNINSNNKLNSTKIQNQILPSPYIAPPSNKNTYKNINIPPPMKTPYNMIPTSNYYPPPPQFNQMNNYMNNNDEELPSMEEIESSKNYNNEYD